MCLILKFKTKKERTLARTTPLVAKKDIHVVKRLLEVEEYDCIQSRYTGKIILKSPYRDFIYERGMIYYQEGKPFSFRNGKAYWYYYNDNYKYRLDVHKGLHAYTSIQAALTNSYKGTSIDAIVPKGSLYYISFNKQEIVSNQLLIPYE